MARHMKHSGVDWLGDIPDDWNVTKVKRIFSIGRGRVIATTELKDNGYPVYSSQTKNNGVLGYIDTYDFDRSQLTWTTDGANAGTVFFREGKHNCTNVCGTLMPKDKNNSLKYLYYALSHIAFYHKRADINGYKIMNNEMAEIEIIIPPIDEQERIAAYLDDKCGRIDSVISKTRATIDEYKKLKQAIITRAVTRGIRPDRTLKHSGIDWLGDIPDDWELVSIGRLFNISAGGDAKPEYYSDTQDEEHPYPVYTNSMNKNQVYAYTSKPIYLANTITVTGRGAIGTAFYRNTPYDAIIRLLSLSPKLDLDCRFYAYWISNVIHFFTDSAAIGQLSAVQMSSYKTAYCSKNEQRKIAAYLDEKTSAIDSLVAKKNQLVAELERLKKSLIFEYVTGKKEVAQ